jgi:hypothetical protein
MALASTSRVQLSYVKEDDFGVTPVAGTVRKLRITGESLNFTLNKESSKEINDSRSSSSMIPISAEAAGGVQAEMQFAEYDPFIEAVLQGNFVGIGGTGISAAFEATITATEITATAAPVGNSAFTTLQRGQWFTLDNTGTANDGKLLRVSKTTAPTATVITLDPGTPAVAGGPFAGTTLLTARLTNGVVQPSFTLQREIGDVGEFFSFRGMTASSMSLSIASGSLSTVEFTFMGRDSQQDNATLLPAVVTDSQAYQIMSGVSGTTCALWANGAPLTGTFINSISFSYDNSLRQQTALCALGAIGIGAGQINATADIEVYFASGATFYAELLNNANIEIAFTSYDAEGNGYIFTFPAANVSSYSVNASGGSDSDLMASISLTALRDAANAVPALRKVVFIDRVGAALLA